MMEPIAVQGILINEPNRAVDKWIKIICVTYLAYYSYIISNYIMDVDTNYIDCIIYIVCGYVYAIWLPIYGLRAIKSNDRHKLSIFSCLQTFLCLWNVLQLVFSWSTITLVINICKKCQETFLAGNNRCYANLYTETIKISEKYCQQPMPSSNQIIISVFQISMAFSSFMGIIYTRRASSLKIITITSTRDAPQIHSHDYEAFNVDEGVQDDVQDGVPEGVSVIIRTPEEVPEEVPEEIPEEIQMEEGVQIC